MSNEQQHETNEAGGALAFVLGIVAVMLLVATLALNVSVSGRSAAARAVQSDVAFACAETALERGKSVVVANTGTWSSVLQGSAVSWYPITGACPGSGTYTYKVTMRDNVDETATANDPLVDIDNTVIVDAEVYRGAIPVAKVSGLVAASSTSLLSDYKKQAGAGSRKEGNQ